MCSVLVLFTWLKILLSYITASYFCVQQSLFYLLKCLVSSWRCIWWYISEQNAFQRTNTIWYNCSLGQKIKFCWHVWIALRCSFIVGLNPPNLQVLLKRKLHLHSTLKCIFLVCESTRGNSRAKVKRWPVLITRDSNKTDKPWGMHADIKIRRFVLWQSHIPVDLLGEELHSGNRKMVTLHCKCHSFFCYPNRKTGSSHKHILTFGSSSSWMAAFPKIH